MDAYAKLHRKAMRYGKTVDGAVKWLDKHFTGDGRKSFRWAMDATEAEISNALRLRALYRGIITRRQKERSAAKIG